jgi:minor extracellular protease Epr
MHFSGKIGKVAAAALALLAAGAAAAQLLPPLPPVGDVVGSVGRAGTDAVDSATRQLDRLGAGAQALADARLERLQRVVRANPERLEMTDLGPAVRGEVIAVDPDAATVRAAAARGFTVVAEERIEGVDIVAVTLSPPEGQSLDRALRQLRRLFPGTEFSANHLHFASGPSLGAAVPSSASQAQPGGPATAIGAIGIIDGGVAAHPALPGRAEQRGFVRGAPAPSAHGTAVASLAVGSGVIRGAAPGAHLFVADVYGRDPAGGNASAIARALGWMAAQRVPVIAVSLVGPPNALVGKAVSRARARGIHIVAAVGNDGPSAPPAYPASYPGVTAVTGVDGRNRVLPEAGRAAHLDYAAAGADMAAAALGGGLVRVRGTSYAVPLVAGRLALALGRGASPIAILDAEAEDLGPRGADKIYGRGLVCGTCRTAIPRK